MLNVLQQRTNRVGDAVFAASRHVWLAGLGAAVVTREWAEKEAANVLRRLVKEGTVVESRAIRLVGDQVESSIAKANGVWKHARASIESTVRTYAETAATVVRRTLPRPLPVRIEAASARKTGGRRTRTGKTAEATKARRATKNAKPKAKR